MNSEDFEKQLMRHEGFVPHAYKDSLGYWTIGIGRLIDQSHGGGITEEEALYLMRNDVEKYAKELADHYPIVRDLDDVRYYVLVNMAFNLGIVNLSKFKKMWANITVGKYAAAADEMLDSLWAKQVGNRATELSEMMRTGVYNG